LRKASGSPIEYVCERLHLGFSKGGALKFCSQSDKPQAYREGRDKPQM